jgi:TfoX N-terminal domain
MTDDELQADRVRRALGELSGIAEKRMFGGICFLLNDHMLCGTGKHGFMFRVGREQEAEALARPGATAMQMNGRRFRGFVRVDRNKCTDRSLRGWVALAQGYVAALPPKAKQPPRGARRAEAGARDVRRAHDYASSLPPKLKNTRAKTVTRPRARSGRASAE